MKTIFYESKETLSAISDSLCECSIIETKANPVEDGDRSSTIEKYKKMANESKDLSVLDFLPLCLSDVPFSDKIDILENLSYTPYECITDIVNVERRLEQAGQRKLARYIRYRSYYTAKRNGNEVCRGQDEFCEGMIKADIELRQLVQRKVHVIRKANFLHLRLFPSEGLTKEDRRDMRMWLNLRDEGDDIDIRYWNLKRKIWRIECDLEPGLVKRAFVALREDPDWYLSDWLRKDCAKKGGCCGRDCGCCERQRSSRDLSRGHCTAGCDCCIAHRGSRGDWGIEDDDVFEIKDSRYGLQMLRAYIWGVDFLNNKN